MADDSEIILLEAALPIALRLDIATASILCDVCARRGGQGVVIVCPASHKSRLALVQGHQCLPAPKPSAAAQVAAVRQQDRDDLVATAVGYLFTGVSARPITAPARKKKLTDHFARHTAGGVRVGSSAEMANRPEPVVLCEGYRQLTVVVRYNGPDGAVVARVPTDRLFCEPYASVNGKPAVHVQPHSPRPRATVETASPADPAVRPCGALFHPQCGGRNKVQRDPAAAVNTCWQCKATPSIKAVLHRGSQ